MFKKFTNACVKLVSNYLPDPFLFCIILTFVLFFSGIGFMSQSPLDMVVHWYDGFWSLLGFAMQMALVLVFGHTLASAPAFKRLLTTLAKLAKTPVQAIILVTVVSAIACFINWGFGLVIGAIFAKELARQVKGVDYRLLIASAYSGFLFWHAGLSGSIPLILAGGGEGVYSQTGGVVPLEGIATSQTIFSSFNLILVVVLLLTIPLINAAMHPNKEDVIVIDPDKLKDEDDFVEKDRSEMTPADKLENSKIITLAISAMGFSYIFYHFATFGFSLNLDIVNFVFLFTAILLHKTPRRFLNALGTAVKGAGPILLQFPFYAGIMGMMTGVNADGVSISSAVSEFFVQIASTNTFPMFSFWSAGLVNLFVPSGGGQWAVQAPIMMPAGYALGVDSARTALTIAWGDVWTNFIQPFWALPALGIAGLGAKDIMGYCIVLLLYSGVILSVAFLFL